MEKLKTYIDPALKTYVVPTELRDNSVSQGKIFTAGTRLPIPKEAKFVRMFTAWGGKTDRNSCDIDLAARCVKNGEFTDLAFYAQGDTMGTHSGDFTSCKKFEEGIDSEITAEYIDVDLDILRREKYKYVLTSNFIYSGADSYDKDFNVYSGIMLLDELRKESEQFIDIDNCLYKMKLQGEYKSHLACAIDIETMEIVIIDKYGTKGRTFYGTSGDMETMKRAYFDAVDYSMNMYNLIEAYCKANDIEVVDNREDAERLVSYNDIHQKGTQMFNVAKNLEKIMGLLS